MGGVSYGDHDFPFCYSFRLVAWAGIVFSVECSSVGRS